MIYTSSKIKNVQQCPFKGYLSTFKYNTEQNKYLHILSLYKKAILLSLKDFGAFFDENVDMKFYTFKQEMEVDRNIFVRNMIRFSRYLYENCAEVEEFKGKKLINYLDQDIRVSIDFVIKYPDRVELVKLSQSDPKLSYSARNAENLPENNFELYLMQLLGEQLYPTENVTTAFYHLKGRYDGTKSDNKEYYNLFLQGKQMDLYAIIGEQEANKSNAKGKREANKCDTIIKKVQGVIDFEGSKGSHIIKSDFYNKDFIDEQLYGVFDKELNMESEKCISSKCSECQYYVVCQAHAHKKVKLDVVKEAKGGFNKKKASPTRAQMDLIEFTKGYCRASAIAGAGKTFSITRRLDRLLDSNNPEDILMITFTQKASEEMAERVAKLTDINPTYLNVSTFNAYCMSLVQKEWDKVGFTKEPELINKIDKIDYIIELLCIDEYSKLDFLNYKLPFMNNPNAKGSIYTMLGHFDKIKAGMFDEDTENKDIIMEMYDVYNSMLIKNNQLEYDDQILLAMQILQDEEMLEKYGFKHVMVDEYNDVNKRQVELLKILEKYSKFESLCVVGDANQSIYAFRLSSPEYMVHFKSDFGEFEDIRMKDNFRSNKEICDLSNDYIRLNQNGVFVDIYSARGQGGYVDMVEYNSLDEEYQSIADYIKENHNGNYHEFAVLGRTSGELLSLQKYLEKAGIPSRLATPQKHMNNHNIRLCINLTKYLMSEDVDSNDYYLFEYVLGSNRHLSDKDDIELLTTKVKESIIDSGDAGMDKLEIFIELAEQLIEKEDDNITMDFLNSILEDRLWTSFNDFASHLIKHVIYFDDSQGEKDETKYNCVTLNSYHSAKGLQYNKLFLLMDKFDYVSGKTDIDDLEEQRRLFYVGITRAEDWLRMVWNNQSDKKRKSIKCEQLVSEIGGLL